MSNVRLLIRTIWHFRIVNAGIVLSVAVCTMVLIGAVIVGDSVRDSLQSIVEKRLGDTDHILVSPRFFTASLAERIERTPLFERSFIKAEPCLMTTGVCFESASGAIATQVNVFGADPMEPGTCIVSQRLARQLGISGDADGIALPATVVLRMDPMQYVSADLLVGRERTDTVILRLKVAGVSEEGSFKDAFSLFGTQRPVKNIWVSLAELQKVLGSFGAANMLFISARPDHQGKDGADLLQALLADVATLKDYGLTFRKSEVSSDTGGSGDLILESKDLILPVAVEEAVEKVFPKAIGVMAYVIDTIRNTENGRECPYAIGAGISRLLGRAVSEDAVVLNSWAAKDFDAKIGDRLLFSYFVRNEGGLPVKQSANFTVNRIIDTSGIGSDRTLVPDYEMITSAESITDWDPPRDFEFRTERIRQIDEDYWERFRAAPRAFISLEKAQEIWDTGHGKLSSVRFTGVTEQEVTRELLQVLTPSSIGLVFRSIRHEQMQSAGSYTDFGQLFLGLGSFLVVSSVLLVALVALLLVEQRSRQIGMMFALGYTVGKIRSLLLAEGLILIAAGGILGVLSSTGYAWLVLEGLKTLWSEAIGTTLIELSVNGLSITVSFLVSVVICAGAIWWGVSRVGRISVAAAVSGKRLLEDRSLPGKNRQIPFVTIGLLVVTAAAPVGVLLGIWSGTAGFYAGGASLLAACLNILYRWLASVGKYRNVNLEKTNLLRLGMRNAARNPARSMLTAGLLASALFIVVSVGAMKHHNPPVEEQGGVELIAAFDIPLPYDLNIRQGREYLGFVEDELWQDARFVNMKSSSGEDISCRNLYRASNPRISSVPGDFPFKTAFHFTSAVSKAADPWAQLDAELDNGAIPAIADQYSARWILHKKLGDTIAVIDEQGNEKQLRIVALLRKSIFQGELLVSEANFKKLFPTDSGYDQVLVAVSPQRVAELKEVLTQGLVDFGITVETVKERLASFAGIAAAYISAFEALGGLGIILGSFGLVVILIRGIAERRGEIALLYALGYPRRSVILMLTAENGFLLAFGMLAGTVSALFAVMPEYVRGGINPASILYTALLLGMIGGGILMVMVWVSSGLVRRISPAALRLE